MANNPLRYTDPTGHIACDDTDANGNCVNYQQSERRKLTNLRREFKKFRKLRTYSEDEMIPTTFVTVGQYSIVQDLTPDEYRLFLSRDGTLDNWDLFEFGLISQSAKDTARRLFPGQSEGNNQRNAFQHAYWSARLTQRFGWEFAESLTTAHEQAYGSEREAQFMDLYNNQVGINIAEANPYASSSQLADLISAAMQNGEMVVIDNHNVYFSNYP